MSDIHDPNHCCKYIDNEFCVKGASNYLNGDGTAPKSIAVNFVIGSLFTFMMLGIYWMDKSTRLSPETWRKIQIFSIPSAFAYPALICLFINKNQCFLYAIWFHCLYGTKYEKLACYLAWYPKGSFLYGNFFLYSLVPVAILLFIALVLRPRWAEQMGQFGADVIMKIHSVTILSEESFNKSTETKMKILYFDALDGLRGSMLAKAILNNPNYSTPFQLHFADKYGMDPGSIYISERIVHHSLQKLGIEADTGVVNVDHIKSETEEDFVKMSTVQSESYDFVSTENYLNYSRMLGTDLLAVGNLLGAQDPFTKKLEVCRVLNAFREVYRILKKDGTFLIYCMENYQLAEMEVLRRYLSVVGFRTRCIRKTEDTDRDLFFGMMKINIGGPYVIIAKKDDTNALNRVFRVSDVNFDVFQVDKHFAPEEIFCPEERHVIQPTKAWYELKASKRYKVYFFVGAIIFCFLLFLLALYLLLHNFDAMLIPAGTNISQYFVWNIINLVTNSPGNLMCVVFPSVYITLQKNKELTIVGSLNIVWTTCILGVFFSLILSLPAWIIDVAISYYILFKCLRVPLESPVNYLITYTIFGLLVYVLYVKFFPHGKKHQVLLDTMPELPLPSGCSLVIASDNNGKAVLDDEKFLTRNSRNITQTIIDHNT